MNTLSGSSCCLYRLPKLEPEESRLPGRMINILDATPFDPREETATFRPREMFPDEGRSSVPKPADFLEAGRGVIVSAREDGRRSEKL